MISEGVPPTATLNQAGDPISHDYYKMGIIHAKKQEYDAALALYAKAVPIQEAVNNRGALAMTFMSMGNAHTGKVAADLAAKGRPSVGDMVRVIAGAPGGGSIVRIRRDDHDRQTYQLEGWNCSYSEE